MNAEFWRGKRVLITGHTGFKGAWLSFWLAEWGAELMGLALPPEGVRNLFVDLQLSGRLKHNEVDLRDLPAVHEAVKGFHPEIVLHLGAQALVSVSYQDPVGTYATNVLGTLHLLEAIREQASVRVALMVTSDKCYDNQDLKHRFRESDPMGGHDIYSSSKGCVEILTASYRHSFFKDDRVAVASVRAGNVIGGGDWAEKRIVPDIVRAAESLSTLVLRRPHAVRPWQHVLEPLSGYLILAEKMWNQEVDSEAWNFGPEASADVEVIQVVEKARTHFPNLQWRVDEPPFSEASVLAIDSSKAKRELAWTPRLSTNEAVDWTLAWYKEFLGGSDPIQLTRNQIQSFVNREPK